jgi:superfamily II DNA or RNA helicase
MSNCDKYNQYYTDIFDKSGKLITSKCFKGNEIYSEMKKFNINNYTSYKNQEYYHWVNTNFNEYSFPPEDYNSEDYNPETAFKSICETSVYSLKPQQKFAGRIFNTYTDNRGILIYHGLGSGKTQTSIIIGEAFKFRSVNNVIIEGRTESRVFIVVPAALKDQYYTEIIGKMENGEIKSASGEIVINGNRQYYSSKTLRKGILQKHNEIIALEKKLSEAENPAKINELTNLIKKNVNEITTAKTEENSKIIAVYEIITHESFLNKLFKITDKQFVEGEYLPLLNKPNGLLIIDEIQNLVSATGVNYRKLLYALLYHAHPKFKTVLLTGTPIYDKAFEFGLLMNLLRPRLKFPDTREQFDKLFINEKMMINKETFKQMCSGYISYFKGGNPIAYPYKKTTIMYHQMEEYQYNLYKDALIDEVKKDKESYSRDEEFFIKSNEKELNTGIFNNSNQFSNIVFPQTATVVKESNLAKNRVNEKVKVTHTVLTKSEIDANLQSIVDFHKNSKLEQNNFELKKILKSVFDSTPPAERDAKILETVRKYSAKFSKVAEMILNTIGSVFVFSNYVYYGVDPMGLIMSHLGYQEFPNKGPNGSYFIWKGEANKYPQLVQQAKKAFNDPKNKDGSLLKIMFGTQTVMEGVDFKNVRQVHILDPWWNDSRMQQIIARAIRLCSHKDLPADQRVVDVFIHISTLGSAEKVFALQIKEVLPGGTKVIRNIKSFLQIENPSEPNSGNWVFRQAYVTVNKENETSIQSSKSTFLGKDIIFNSIVRLPDAGLTKTFGKHKQLDSRSVQEYMYSRSLDKLNLNRQFEKAIKEVSIDCNINKNGNVIRLDELYTPYLPISNTYQLTYENYSTGETFNRLNVKITPGLPMGVLTLQDILDNTAKNSRTFEFTNKNDEIVTFNKSLIIPENINCEAVNYAFDNKLPREIINLTINKELLFYLKKLKKKEIMEYLYHVQFGYILSNDPELPKKIKQFIGKGVVEERQKIIDALKSIGFNGDDDLWDLYTLEELKIEFKRIKK